MPPLETYRGPYDVFKRRSEEIIERACTNHALTCTHLRMGAMFSNDQVDCLRVHSAQLCVHFMN